MSKWKYFGSLSKFDKVNLKSPLDRMVKTITLK